MPSRCAYAARLSFIALSSIGLAKVASATNINVCPTCAHTTIQSAVNAAVSGDVIQIAAGRYTENVLIENKHLTLNGAPGGQNGVSELYAAARGPALVLGTGNAGDPAYLVEIHGLTISHGSHISGTRVGGGVQVRSGAYLNIFDSVITQNVANIGGGIGINTGNGPASTITRCLISENSAVSAIPSGLAATSGGGVAVYTGTVSIVQSTISRNQVTGNFGGGGIVTGLGGPTNLTLTDSTVSENTATAFLDSSGVSGGDGGGLYLAGDFTISGSTIAHNLATGETAEGGGLFIGFYDSGTHVLKNTIVSLNSFTGDDPSFKGEGGGILAFVGLGSSPPQTLTLNNVYVVDNLAGAGVALSPGMALHLTNTTIKGNVGGNCIGEGCPP
jgi:hypothetical protein